VGNQGNGNSNYVSILSGATNKVIENVTVGPDRYATDITLPDGPVYIKRILGHTLKRFPTYLIWFAPSIDMSL